MFLDIQPITLNLLGLELQTSRITLDLNAIPGEGNLLGNLVCALAGLLDGTPDAIGEITDQLKQIFSGAGLAPAGAADVEETVEETTGEDVAEPTAPVDAEPTEPAPEPTVPAGTPVT